MSLAHRARTWRMKYSGLKGAVRLQMHWGLSASSKHSGLVSRAGPCASLALEREIATNQRLRRRLDISISCYYSLLACATVTNALEF